MRVLIAARDVRVRRSLHSLLELDGNRVVAATDTPRLLPGLEADLGSDLVVLELSRRDLSQDLRVVEELARRGGAVIAVSSGSAACAAVLAAGALACLDKDCAFTERLAEAVRAVTGPRMSAPPS
jgi:DNA-binding NarL/FixJ family response regulator